MKYEQRVVAFIDILGFKTLLDGTLGKDGNDNEDAIDAVVSAYEEIYDIWNLDEGLNIYNSKPSQGKKVSIFSDCVVVSFEIDRPSEVFYTLLEIKWLIMRLIDRGMLCRGAVSMGKFIHTDRYLFGPALVEAYMLESKAAMYPRVILDHAVIEAGINNRGSEHTISQEEAYVHSLLEQDSDGMYYIDYFFKAQSELDDPENDFPRYIDNLANIIRKGLMGSSHHSKADLRVKFSWMRERYNRMVEIVTSKEALNQISKSGSSDVTEFYTNLRKISPKKYKSQMSRK